MSFPLLLIVVAELFGASLWFSVNGVADALLAEWGLGLADLGYLTGAVQLGFISGTLLIAVTGWADRWSASRIFAVSAWAGALSNAALLLVDGLGPALLLRFATGLTLAGVYPLGMKLVVSWTPERAGYALGWLVGMLTLGTALPHGVRGLGAHWPWQWVLLSSSLLAVCAGGMLWRLGDGPHLPPGGSTRLSFGAVWRAYRVPGFRAAGLGYFGHMWELYAWWAFVPLWLTAYSTRHGLELNWSLWAFLIIAIGFFGCAGGGIAALRLGSGRVAVAMLSVSGSLCAISPWLFDAAWPLTAAALLIWGIAVIGDSAQFSALNAANAPRQYVGSALTLVNSIGFGITVLSIEWLNWVAAVSEPRYWFLWLLPGPVVGLFAMSRRGRVRSG